MRKTRLLVVSLLLISVFGLLVGCTRDPKARKAKYIASGDAYMKQAKYREAMIEYANAVKIDGADANAHYLLAQAYMKGQVWPGAFAELTRAVEIQPGLLPAQLDLGNLFLAGKKTAEARQKAQLVLSKEPQNAGAFALLANIEAAEQHLDEAIAEIQKAINASPNNSGFYLNLAILQANKKDFAAAEVSAKKSIEIKPTDDAHQFLARIYAFQQRWPEAELEAKAAVATAPQSLTARINLANLYVSEQKNDAAEQTIIQAKKDLGKDSQTFVILADYYLGRGQIDKALAEFAVVSKEHPKDLTIKKQYTELLLMTNKDSDAQRLTDEILKGNPKDLEGLIYRSTLQLKQGKTADAIQGLQTATKSDASNPFAHFMLGQAYRASGENERAKTELSEAVRLNPRLILAHRALAEIAAARGDINGLSAAADALIQNMPNSPDGYIDRGVVEISRNQPDKAAADFQKAIQIAPNDPNGYMRLGFLRVTQKKIPEGQNLFEQALSVAPNSGDALQMLIATYVSQKQQDKAIARAKEQIAKSPNTSVFHVILGVLEAESKDFTGARASLQKAIELDPNNMQAFAVLGQIQVASGSLDDAVKSWDTWMQKNPKDIRPYVMISGLEQNRNNWQKAQQMLQKGLEVAPDNAVACNNLAYLLLEHGGNVDQALTLAQTARRQSPDSPNIADTLGYAYYKKGIFSSAVDLFEEAAKKQPDNASIQYHLGFALEKARNTSEARAHLQKALQLDPKNADANEAKQLLIKLGRS